jgi:hypothetical protein
MGSGSRLRRPRREGKMTRSRWDVAVTSAVDILLLTFRSTIDEPARWRQGRSRQGARPRAVPHTGQ